jgi:hypothetical protein
MILHVFLALLIHHILGGASNFIRPLSGQARSVPRMIGKYDLG